MSTSKRGPIIEYVEKPASTKVPVVEFVKLTTVVNIKRGQPYDVFIGRAGHGEAGTFGNPFNGVTRETSIAMFKQWFLERVKDEPEFRAQVLALKGKRLGCFCSPLRCHGDVIAWWVDHHE